MDYENNKFHYFMVRGQKNVAPRQVGKYLAVMDCEIAREVFASWVQLCVVDDFGNLVRTEA